MAGLKPNDFFWIIEGKLAVSECIGGGGLTARKIRREEEIQWLKSQGINSIFSLLDSDFNLKNYQEVGFRTYHFPLGENVSACLLYTSPSPRDKRQSRMPSSA